MKAQLTETQYTGKIRQNRKEKSYYASYLVIDKNLKKLVELRFYGSNTIYACIWAGNDDVYVSGGGHAGGGGYHKESAAAQEAINNAGIKLDQDISGVGDAAIVDALEAIARALGARKYKTFHTHA